MSLDSAADLQYTVQDAVRALTDAAQDAVDTDDYITYSTLLDIYLTNSERYKESERITILQALDSILRNNVSDTETLLSSVAWDLPVLLLPYLSSSEAFDIVAASPTVTSRKAALRIFNLIAEKGNAKEVFLKAIEALSSLSVDSSFDATPEQNLDSEKLFVLQFYALFEVIISVTRRITTQYPSRFLATSSTALLSFFSNHVDDLSDQSLPVLLRRLYLFSRDYIPPPSKSPVDPEEELLQRLMLQSYATHMVEIMLRNQSVDWSRRYFAVIKPELEILPERERKRAVTFEGIASANIVEMMERFLQLTSSFDIAPEVFAETILADPPEMEPENEEDVDPSFPTPPQADQSIPLSAEGCFLLLAEYLISDPRAKITFTATEVIKIITRFLVRENGEAPGAGVCDAVGFFAWKFLKDVDQAELDAMPSADFNGFLQLLTSLSATSSIPPVRFLFHTLVTHLLRKSSPERAFAYIYDTLEYCPFENVRGAFVIVLKDFLNSAEFCGTKEQPSYDKRRQAETEQMILATLEGVESSPELLLDERYSTLLAWVSNFLAVIHGSKQLLDSAIPRLRALIESDAVVAESAETEDDERTEREVRERILATGVEFLENGRLASGLGGLQLADVEAA
ncbi:YAP-binding/ALF4/Glomulin [Limtongia smithiae]|uniref:YAP-binding/ALF4/Glomulin n=1 Tax=Limtongia smithiae TaxID=1125753 RepID=UPI0034CD3DD4